MSDENKSLGEVSGRARKEETIFMSTVGDPEDFSYSGEVRKVYRCRLERSLKEGEKPEAFNVIGADAHEAAVNYVKSLDAKNPRPPRERVVLVEYTDPTTDTLTLTLVRITCRASIVYDADIFESTRPLPS